MRVGGSFSFSEITLKSGVGVRLTTVVAVSTRVGETLGVGVPVAARVGVEVRVRVGAGVEEFAAVDAGVCVRVGVEVKESAIVGLGVAEATGAGGIGPFAAMRGPITIKMPIAPSAIQRNSGERGTAVACSPGTDRIASAKASASAPGGPLWAPVC